jgi:acyl transferase domain-containing protein
VRTRRLPVSAAFHSPLVSAASRPFEEALRGVVFAPGPTPVFSNTTALPYPEDPEAARALLGAQLSRPVNFISEVENLHAAGARTFLEVGPSNKLTGLVSAILAGKEYHAIALDASSGKGPGILDLAKAIAQLSALGHAARLEPWDEGYDPSSAPREARPGVTVSLCGANYVKARPVKPPSRPAASPSSSSPRVPVPAARSQPELSPQPAASGAPGNGNIEATLAAILRMQKETADTHRRFLEGQEAAQRSLEILLGLSISGSVPGSVPSDPQYFSLRDARASGSASKTAWPSGESATGGRSYSQNSGKTRYALPALGSGRQWR